ncbi:MAG: dipeptide epimerase [Chloroflexi bacterium]|nr:dipeptide epimerase [Chloroflexota bacterium]
MHIRSEKLSLQLENPFKISYGATTTRQNALVHLSDGELTGVGEAAVVPYYGETPERVTTYFENLPSALAENVLLLEDALTQLPPTESSAARAAVDMALHDLWAKKLGQPLYRLWGLNPERCATSSYTVALADDEAAYRKLVANAQGFPVVKLKLGSGSLDTDLKFTQIAMTLLSDAQICVDANGGWSAPDALKIIPQLAEMRVLFVEQPVAKHDFAGWRMLRQQLPKNMPPLIADESVQGVESVIPLAGLVDGINIKLAKCGGLQPARQMIALARALGMQVMIGCMVESSVAISAAATLTPLADYADLDGNLLITNDPYRGARNVHGKMMLPILPGLGVERLVE